MGTNVYNDIHDFDERQPVANGKKVILIYTTAGDLNDDDTKTCECKDVHDTSNSRLPYWKVREAGARNSTHFAACRMGGWGPLIPYPEYTTAMFHDHTIARYEYKNTISYFMRIKAGMFAKWATNPSISIGTVDSSATYKNWADFVATLYYIYNTELNTNVPSHQAFFNFPEFDTVFNKADHNDHLLTGRAAAEAAKILGGSESACFPENLFVGYNTQNLPVNISKPDAPNEAALTAVYCLALLDFNAWPEWSPLYQEWTTRNYYRATNTCDAEITGLSPDTAKGLRVVGYNNPVNKNLMLQFNQSPDAKIKIDILNGKGEIVREEKTKISNNNLLNITTEFLLDGTYSVELKMDHEPLTRIVFEVKHTESANH